MRRLLIAIAVVGSSLPTVAAATVSPAAPGGAPARSQAEAPEILTTALPDAHIGFYYSFQLQATGGVATDYYWHICVGWTPPDGMNIMPDGSLEGWPQPSLFGSTVNICAHVSVQSGQISTTKVLPLEIDVDNGTGPNPVVVTDSLPAATEGVPYSFQLQASGGDGSGYVWLLCPGWGLPGGLSLSSSGVVSGTPTPNTQPQVEVCVRVLSGGSSGRLLSLGLLDAGPRTWGVTIFRAKLTPASIAIASGDWVRWTNRSGGRRTLETGSGELVEVLSPGEVFSHRLHARRVHSFRLRQTGQTLKVAVS